VFHIYLYKPTRQQSSNCAEKHFCCLSVCYIYPQSLNTSILLVFKRINIIIVYNGYSDEKIRCFNKSNFSRGDNYQGTIAVYSRWRLSLLFSENICDVCPPCRVVIGCLLMTPETSHSTPAHIRVRGQLCDKGIEEWGQTYTVGMVRICSVIHRTIASKQDPNIAQTLKTTLTPPLPWR
jgi:hypothetical protein